MTALELLVHLSERSPKLLVNVAGSSLIEIVTNVLNTSRSAFSSASSIREYSRKAKLLLEIIVNSAASSDDLVGAQLGSSALLPLLTAWNSFQDMDICENMLQSLLAAAEYASSLVIAVMQPLIRTCLSIATTDKTLQLQAVQVVAAVCEIPAVKRIHLDDALKQEILNGNSESQSVLSMCLQALCEQHPDEIEEQINDDTISLAHELLESLIFSFGPLAITPLLSLVEACSCKRAALEALQCAVEAAPIAMQPYVPVTLQAASALAYDGDWQTQYQATLLLGLLSEREFSDAQNILPVLTHSCQHSQAKVASIGCRAIVSFARHQTPEAIIPNLSNVLKGLVTGPMSLSRLSDTAIDVQINAVGAMASLAMAVGGAFSPYYTCVMPGLIELARIQPSSYEEYRLQGAALEAATIVGHAVEDIFASDAHVMMQEIMPHIAPSDQMLSACARIASVLKEKYAPYAKLVIPELIKRATANADVDITDGDEVGLERSKFNQIERDEATESMTVALPGRGLTKITINTSQIQEKTQAVRGLYEHAVAMGASFGPYCKSSLDEFLVLTRFKFSAEIRSTSAQTLAAIFEAACCFGEELADMSIPQTYLPLVIKSIASQLNDEINADLDTLYAIGDSLSEVNYSVYNRLRSSGMVLLANYKIDDANETVKYCMRSLVQCLERRNRLSQILRGVEGVLTGDDEREQVEGEFRREAEIVCLLVDSVGYTLKFFKADFLPIFDRFVVPIIGPYLNDGDDIRARVSAVCLFDDAVEHCGYEAANRLALPLMNGILRTLEDATNEQDADLLQASLYGISQVARYAPEQINKADSRKIVQKITAILSVPVENVQNVATFENAVSAVAALFLARNAPLKSSVLIKHDTALNLFLHNLPIREDEDEAKICHAILCQLLEAKEINLVNECQLLLRIIGEIFMRLDDGEDLADEDTTVHLACILHRLQSEVQPHIMQSCFASITPQEQTAINAAMSEYAHRFGNVVSP